jgi:hypothetical protein
MMITCMTLRMVTSSMCRYNRWEKLLQWSSRCGWEQQSLSFTFCVKTNFGCQQLCKRFWRKSRNVLGVIRRVQKKDYFLPTLPAGSQYGSESQTAHTVQIVSTVSGIERRAAVRCAMNSGHLKTLRKNHNRTTINDETRRELEVITVL